MNRQDILREYSVFAKGQYEGAILSAGGALVMHGLRLETSDMDVDISKEAFKSLLAAEKHPTHIFNMNGNNVLVIEYNSCIDVHETQGKHETIVIDGVVCFTLTELLAQKLLLNRDKDQADIASIKAKLITETGRTVLAQLIIDVNQALAS